MDDGDAPMEGGAGDLRRDERAGERGDLEKECFLKDRFRLSVISIAEAGAKKNKMQISELVVACVAELACKFSDQLARNLELFARHANRKSVNTQDVVLSAHRNEHLAAMLSDIAQELNEKNPPSERKRKRASKREDDTI